MYMSKVMGLILHMDASIGKDFEAGLATLKAAAEGDARAGEAPPA